MDTFSYLGSDGCTLHAATLGRGPAMVLLGPDHHGLVPLARQLAESYTVVLPDVRGYGRSVCTDPARHTWTQYADDVDALMRHLGLSGTALGGAGIGGTIALRAAAAYPQYVRVAVVIGVEGIDDDTADQDGAAKPDVFAARVRHEGIDAARKSRLLGPEPVIGSLVRDAIARSDPASIAAARAIGRDRAFAGLADLASVTSPALIIPGSDLPRPTALAERIAGALPQGRLADVALSSDLRTADDLARKLAPTVWAFLTAQLGICAAMAAG